MIPTHIKRRLLYSQRRFVGGKMRTTYHKITGSGMQPVTYMKKSGRSIYGVMPKSGSGFMTDALRALGHGSVDFLANRFGSGLSLNGSASRSIPKGIPVGEINENTRDSILASLSASKHRPRLASKRR